MADARVEYLVEILKRGDGAKQAAQDLQQVEAAAGRSEKSLGGMTASFQRLFAVLGGTAALRSALEAFLAQSNALSRLREMSGATTEQMGELHDVAEQLSQLMGRDLNRAVQALGQALRGDVDQFKAMGFAINEALSPTQQFNSVIDEIRRRFENRELSDPVVAEVEKIKKAFDDLEVGIGQALAYGIGAVNKLASVVGSGTGGTNLESQETQRDNLLQMIARQQGSGRIGRKQADELEMLLAGAFATREKFIPASVPGTGSMRVPVQVMDQSQRQEVIDRVMAALSGAGGSGFVGAGGSNLSTPSLRDADMRQARALLESTTQQLIAAENVREQLETERERRSDEASRRQVEQGRRTAEELQRAQDDLVLSQLTGQARVMAQLEIDHRQRLDKIRDTSFEEEEHYAKLIELENQRHANEVTKAREATTMRGRLRADMVNIAQQGMQLFSQGLASAIVDAFQAGDKAFQQFASNFLRLMSEMILQALILRAIQGIAGSLGGGGSLPAGNTGVPYPTALGGQFMRLAAGGMAELNGPTLFPRWGVLAGEAGREMMTVLARPRVMNIGGINATVGNVGTRTLAVAEAGDLARRGGAGGTVEVVVHLAEGLRAEIVNESVQSARVRVVQDMTQDTALSRRTRELI